MAIIPEDQLKRLQDAGLFVSKPARSTHVMPDFVFINKPISVSGNSIPDFETQYGLDQALKFDTPFLRLYFDNQKWIVLGVDHTPAPGPGDFTSEWETVGEALDDIIDFYFGEAQRMNEKAQQKAKIRARIRASNDDK